MPARSYKAVFCEHLGCPQEKFLEEVFQRCLYPHAVPLAYFMGKSEARVFSEDRKAIEQFGLATSFDDVRAIIEDLRYVNQTNKSWLRTSLKIRVSGRRLYLLAEKLSRKVDPAETGAASRVRGAVRFESSLH